MTTIFAKPGSFPKPGLIGRGLRIIFGCVLLYFFILTLTNFANYVNLAIPKHLGMWLGVGVSFYFLSEVINVGFTRSWGRRPQIIAAVAAVAAVAFDFLLYGHFWGPQLGLFIFILLAYVTGHAGLSFVLSGILASPG